MVLLYISTALCWFICSHVQGRVATAVLYCKAADRGGATAFTKADVFVKGKRGAATFFTYKGPDGRTDEGYAAAANTNPLLLLSAVELISWN